MLNTLNIDIKNNIKDYIIFKPKNKDELQEAVDLWCKNKSRSKLLNGHISNWDTSLIIDMSYLFKAKKRFNDNMGGIFSD